MLVSTEESQSGLGMGSFGEAVFRAEAGTKTAVLMIISAPKPRRVDEEVVPQMVILEYSFLVIVSATRSQQLDVLLAQV